MDIGKAFPRTLTDEGVALELRDPRTGAVLTDGDQPVTITLLGYDSDEVTRTRRQQINKRLELMSKTGKQPVVSLEEQEAETLERLVAATIGWSFDTLDGQPFLFSPTAARVLYTDKRFGFIRNQVILFMEDSTNFFKK